MATSTKNRSKNTGAFRNMLSKLPEVDEKKIMIADIIEGKVLFSDELREMVRSEFESLMKMTEYDLILKAKSLGYELSKLLKHDLEFWKSYLKDLEDSPEVAERLGVDVAREKEVAKNIIEHVKSVATWDDYTPILDIYKNFPPRDEGMAPHLPVDLVDMCFDNRLETRTVEKIEKVVLETEAETILVLAKMNKFREAKGIPDEVGAHILEMDIYHFRKYMEFVENRVKGDEELSKSFHIFCDHQLKYMLQRH